MGKIQEWGKLTMQLKAMKEQELNLRKEICDDLFEGRVGEFSVKTLVDGVPVKATSKLNRKLDEASLSVIWDDLSPEEQACIKHKPALQVGPFKKLEKDDKVDLLHEAITVVPATPTLEILSDD